MDKNKHFLRKTETSGEIQWFTNGVNRATGRLLRREHSFFARSQLQLLHARLMGNECVSASGPTCNSTQVAGQAQSLHNYVVCSSRLTSQRE